MHKVDARDAPEISAGRNSCGENKSMIADAARLLVWQNTEDGQKGRNQPRSILSILRNDAPETGSGFDTVEEFQAWRASMIGGDSSA